MNKHRNTALTVALVFLGLALWLGMWDAIRPPQADDASLAQRAQNAPRQPLSYSELMRRAGAGELPTVFLAGRSAYGVARDGTPFTAVLPGDSSPSDQLVKMGVDVRAVLPVEPSPVGMMLLSWVPLLLIGGGGIYMVQRMAAAGAKGGAGGFGRSRARLHTPDAATKVTFADVAGIEEARDDLMEVVDFLKSPAKFQRIGGKIPKGVLLVGPPGTGKTLTARAMAGEADVPFFTISGSDFVEMYVGVGASRVRDLFEQGKKNAPCIIFIDEIDAVGRHRGAGVGGGNDEREQTLNQLLVEMDGFEANAGIILVAATNRPDVLDPALLRPGRFDRQVVVPSPDIAGREKILGVHMRKVPLSPDVDPRTIARGTPGFSGADLANLVNEAALLAARRNLRVVGPSEFDSAKDKIMMGAERRSLTVSDEERRLTAVHEAGHALCAVLSPASDPIHKATVVPRGRALGMVMRLPEGDRVSMTVERLEADLTVAYGGRVAEEMEFGPAKVTTGAAADIQAATAMARRMVTEWGMSPLLGAVRYADNQEEVFLGRSVARTQTMSEETARQVDDEIRRIAAAAMERATVLLKKNADTLRALAAALLEHETLTGDDVRAVVAGTWVPTPRAVAQEAPVDTPADVAPEPKKATSPWLPAWGRHPAGGAAGA